MKKDTLCITDPAFNEYLYSVLFNAAFEDCEKLPPKYHKLIKSEKSAKRFINNSGWDEKMLVLSYLGVNSFYIIDERSINSPSLKKVVSGFKENQKSMSLSEVVKSGLYISSNKQLIGVLTLMAQAINSNSYTYNMEYKRIGYSIKKWSNQLGKGEFEENTELNKYIVKALYSSNSVFKRTQDLFNIKPNEIQLLLYFYLHVDNYTAIAKVWDDNAAMLTKLEITNAIKILKGAAFIDQHPLNHKREYCITAKGIKVISDYKTIFAKTTNFN